MSRAALALLVLLAACGGAPAQPASADPARGPLEVFAAASLTEAFQQEAQAFAAVHPAARVSFNFAGSPTLVTQITQGAPADVFAAADHTNMQKLVDAGLTSEAPRDFASNRLQIVVPAGNPKGIRGLSDLAAPGLVVVLCAPAVPCGAYAQQSLAKAAVKVAPRSQEQDVKSVVSKVALGEADAGIVYVTDVRAGGPKVAGVDIPDAVNVPARYPAAVVKDAAHATAGRLFADFLLSPRGQRVLGDYGFGPP